LVLDLIKVPVFSHLGIAESAAISTTGGPKSKPISTTQSAAEQSNPANAKPAAKIAPAPEVKAKTKPDAAVAAAPEDEPKPPSDLTPKLVERVHALYEELGRQDVLAVQEFEQAQKTSKEKTMQ
jgi:H+-transporting ATPase